jgi:putative hydrolase of the HAD superfamily
MSKGAIIFDGDDTLWMTQRLYQSALDIFYLRLEEQGFNEDDAHPLFNAINDALRRNPVINLSSARLGQAMCGTYISLCDRAGIFALPSLNQELTELAQQVYLTIPKQMDGLHEVLSSLAKDFTLFFYSAGETNAQRNRLAKFDLEQYFGKRLFIVTKKDKSTLQPILSGHDLRPETTWIVGNSLRFEINPGANLHLHRIWMHTDFWVNDHEDTQHNTFVAFSLREIPNIIAQGSGFEQTYHPSASEALELRATLSSFSSYEDVWVVGTSPALDINPASTFGVKLIWIPTEFDPTEIEPFNCSMFVAFSEKGALDIIDQWSQDKTQTAKVIKRIRQRGGKRGNSILVE